MMNEGNTFFTSAFQEFPYVRYRAAKTIDVSTLTTLRDLIPTKLAAAVWNCLTKHKSSIVEFPQSETCELLIVDRSIDQVCLRSLQIYINDSFFFFFAKAKNRIICLTNFWKFQLIVSINFTESS
jgi:hypothetical protein